MPYSCQMASELPRRDRVSLLRKGWNVSLHRRVQIELPRLHEQRNRRRGYGLGDAPDAQLRARCNPNTVLDVCQTEPFRPYDFAVNRNRDGQSRDLAFYHAVANERPSFCDRASVTGVGWRARWRNYLLTRFNPLASHERASNKNDDLTYSHSYKLSEDANAEERYHDLVVVIADCEGGT